MTDVGCRCQDNWVKLGIVPARAEPFSNRVVMLVLGSQQRSWYQREASMSLSPEREKPELHLDSRHQAKWSIAYLPCSEITSGPPERGQTATSGRTARTSPSMRSFTSAAGCHFGQVKPNKYRPYPAPYLRGRCVSRRYRWRMLRRRLRLRGADPLLRGNRARRRATRRSTGGD